MVSRWIQVFWFQENPYAATLKEEIRAEGWVDLPWSKLQEGQLNPDWRIFARSASDDKGPFMMLIAALNTLKKENKTIPYNLKIILDFEEEIGSPRLAKAIKENQKTLAADMLLIFDGPKHPSNAPTVTFGARGITRMTITVFGPTYPLHSGHYGNYAPKSGITLV